MKTVDKSRTNAEKSLTAPDEIAELAMLYDKYGELIKEGQQEIFEAYVLDNLTLAEIADECDMTRQGVYDTINRARKKLREYEKKLHLVENEKKISDHLMRIESIAGDDAVREEARLIRELI